MKKNILTVAILVFSVFADGADSKSKFDVSTSIELNPINDWLIGLGGDPNKVPVKGDPGRDAEVILETVHEKTVVLEDYALKVKWTKLGYGAITEKIIVPELAKHTVFNHRNPGEEGPCLRSFRSHMDFLGDSIPVLDHRGDLEISIKILNKYEINREKKICRVSMVEDVRTTTDGVEFSHRYTQDMGFRYIGDCPESVE